MLNEWSNGDPNVLDNLMPLIYDELRRQANAYLRHENPNHTLQATALIHETYLKLIDQREAHFNSRSHFFAIAANMMRRILVDHARTKHRDRREGNA
ncbi:MAG TPA: ECF-type sigma factor, partial [Pyrinomonadaceae bacterium]|nr:ECF-type sigma factor [Pyrinomonadaceae bacterium]